MNTAPASPLQGRFLYPVIVAAAVAAGCATSPQKATRVEAAYDPSVQARLRVHGNNGVGIVFHEGKTCLPDTGGVRASGTLTQSLQAMIATSGDVRIGMPESARTRQRRHVLLGREFFIEYVVAADQRIGFMMSFSMPPVFSPDGRSSRSGGCGPYQVSFVPAAGQDYEVYLQGCRPHIERIGPQGELLPVEMHGIAKCVED